jgi:hypothetical protein
MDREALGLSLGLGLGIAPGRMPVPRGRGQRADDGEGMKLERIGAADTGEPPSTRRNSMLTRLRSGLRFR